MDITEHTVSGEHKTCANADSSRGVKELSYIHMHK
jgi:hypothetical protein